MSNDMLKKRNVKIYQTCDRDLRFTNYLYFVSLKGYVSPFEFGYNLVYSEDINLSIFNNLALDAVYVTFKINRPESYTGRLMSVSDIVSIDNEYYYVDTYDFKKIIVENDTNVSYFHKLIKRIKDEGHYADANKIIDYILVHDKDVRTLTSYEFNFVSSLCWGSNEGIYIDCYLEGKFDNSTSKKLKVATIKSLETSVDAFKTMGELAGTLTYYGKVYVDENINMFDEKAS